MSGITDLQTLLENLSPILVDGEFVFLTRPDGSYGDGAELKPVAAFFEAEGLTLVVRKHLAETNGELFHGVFRMISLQVQSDLEAVGLTAAVAEALTKRGISANVIAAFHHDHVFVPTARAEDAMDTLHELTKRNLPES